MKQIFVILTVLFVLTSYGQLIEDDFEDGTLDAWSTLTALGGYAEVNTSSKKNGTYGAEIGVSPGSVGYNYAYAWEGFSSAQSEVWGKCYFQVVNITQYLTSASSTQGCVFGTYEDANWDTKTIMISVRYDRRFSNIELLGFGGIFQIGSTQIINEDQWYELKIWYKNSPGTTTDSVGWWLDGTLIAKSKLYSSNPLNDADIGYWGIRGLSPTNSNDEVFYFDDVGFYTSDPDASTGWAGKIMGVTDPGKVNDIDVSNIDNVIENSIF